MSVGLQRWTGGDILLLSGNKNYILSQKLEIDTLNVEEMYFSDDDPSMEVAESPITMRCAGQDCGKLL